MLSVVSWYTQPFIGSYSASKAAEFALTNGVRIELRAQGTLVVGVHAGYIDTDLTASFKDVDKISPVVVAEKTMEAITAGAEEVLADEPSQMVRAALAADPQALNQQMQQLWDSSR